MSRQIMDMVRGQFYVNVNSGERVRLTDIEEVDATSIYCWIESIRDGEWENQPVHISDFISNFEHDTTPEPFHPSYLEDIIPNIAEWIREHAKETDESYINYSLIIRGRVLGDFEIVHSVANTAYSSNSVESHSMEPAMYEWKHRVGYAKRNKAALLTYAGDLKIE